MRQEPVGQAICPVEGCQLLDRGLGLEVEERQCVIPAVPGEEGGVAVNVGHVEGSSEVLHLVGEEEGGTSVLEAGRYRHGGLSTGRPTIGKRPVARLML